MMENSAGFIACFPPIQSAITFHGNGGMRIQLDISENQIGEAAKLLMWREQLLQVTVVAIDGDDISIDDKLESIDF